MAAYALTLPVQAACMQRTPPQDSSMQGWQAQHLDIQTMLASAEVTALCVNDSCACG